MYRILKLNESAKLEEKDTVQDYIDFCKDMNIEPKDKKSVDKYMNVFSRMYAQYNGLATLKAAKQQKEAELNKYLAEGAKADRKFIEELIKSGALDDINELKTTEEYEDAVNYWIDHYYDDASKGELQQAKEDGVLTEAEEDLEDKIEDEEKEEEIEDNQEETLDSEEDQEENPVEEESTVDNQLDELRDILVDLDDIRLYKIVSEDKEEFYILGKVAENSNDVEMLVDTQPIDFEGKEDSEEPKEINPEEINQKFQFISLPLKFEDIKDMNPKYGEDLNPNHEEIVTYLMNLLVEQNPEAAEEHKEEKIEEPKDEELPEVPEEIINSEEEDEDEEI